MKKQFFILFLLFFASASFAASLFSCQPIVNYNGRYFTDAYTQGQFIGTCSADTSRLDNYNFTSGAGFSVDSLSRFVMTGFCGSFSCDDAVSNFNILNVSALLNNGTVMSLAGGISHSGAGQTNCNAQANINGHFIGTCVGAAGSQSYTQGAVTFTPYNSTCANLTISTPASSFLFCEGESFKVGNFSSGNIPPLNTTALYMTNFNSGGWGTSFATFRLVNESGKISKAWGGNLTNYDSFSTTNTFQAILVQGNYLMMPLHFWYPGTTEYAYATAYSNVTTISFVKNNTVTYVYDNVTNLWYSCSPYIAPSSSIVYTIQCIPSIQNQQYQSNISSMFLSQSCWTSGNNFNWAIRASSNFDFLATAIYNTTINNTAVTGTYFNGSYPILQGGINATNITVTANGQLVCFIGQDNGMLNFPSIMTSTTVKIIGSVFILFIAGIGVAVPPANLAIIAINDIFKFVAPSTSVAISLISVALGMALAWNGGKNLKNVMIHISMLLVVLGYFVTVMALPGIPALTSVQDSFASLAISVSSQGFNPLAIIASGAGLVYNVVIFMLALPLTLYGLVVSPLVYVNATLYSIVSMFGIVFTAGLYLVIILKGVEIVLKPFIPY